jgi:hypothetical protein
MNDDRDQLARLSESPISIATGSIKGIREILLLGLGSHLRNQIATQAQAGVFVDLTKVIEKSVAAFQTGFQITPEQARLCLAYLVLFPDQVKPKFPRLATPAELRSGNKKKKGKK